MQRQSVYQDMFCFECCEVADVNLSFSLSFKLRSSVCHGVSSCAGRRVLELMLFFTRISCLSHSTFIAFFSEGPLEATRGILGR